MDFSTLAGSGLTVTLSPGQLLVTAALFGVVIASNAKSVLFAWHGRLLTQLARHLVLGTTVKRDVFSHVVTTSYTPLLDIDYNLHKSNSTFFVDLDDSRTELMLALFKDVVKERMFHLGGTSCMFRRAIPPFAKYEVSSRVLCWDEKWVYIVSHFTKPGAHKKGKKEDVYATAITKYVFKQARITCTPESILQDCGLKGELDNEYCGLAQNFSSLDQLHDTFSSRSALYYY